MLAKQGGIRVLEQIEFDEDDDILYEEVKDNFDDNDNDDELADALASLQLKQTKTSSPTGHPPNASNVITQVRPSVVDDFIRNFLIKAGMSRSLDVFNAEWYELQSKGKLAAELSSAVPDIYLRNEELDQQVVVMREQMEKMREVAAKAQSTWDMFRKERDFHRMHHKRVVHEKNKLVDDLKRLRNNLRSYEPVIEELKKRHESALKEKMLIRLERDRLSAKVKNMEEQISNVANQVAQVETKESTSKSRSATRSVRKQGTIPVTDPANNPYLDLEFDPVNLDNFVTTKSSKAHLNSVSCVAFHPKKSIFATGSDDETWKLWTAIDGELIMSGEGHTGWLSGVHFHPHGSHLATSSGDGTVKIWEFGQAKCTHTFTDHSQAVWGCEFHYAGDFVASCSMDHTVRIWDLISGKCRQTLRGHVDSVNALQWQPYTSNLCTASGDKTLSLWDGRTGLCVFNLYGHVNAVNHLGVTNRGDVIASCDADGTIKVWDVRMVKELGSIDLGPVPANKLTLDRSGTRAVVAQDDGSLKVVNLETMTLQSALTGHDAAVQCVSFAPNDAFLVSGSSDSVLKIWRG